MTRTEGTELIPGWGPKGTSREPGWFRCGRTAPRRHDRREGPHGHPSCMPRSRRPPVSHDDMRAGARGRRAGDSHVRGKRLRGDGRVDGRLPTAVPRRVRERPRGFVPARMLTRGDTPAGPVASPRPPSSADSRPGRNDGPGAPRAAFAGAAGEGVRAVRRRPRGAHHAALRDTIATTRAEDADGTPAGPGADMPAAAAVGRAESAGRTGGADARKRGGWRARRGGLRRVCRLPGARHGPGAARDARGRVARLVGPRGEGEGDGRRRGGRQAGEEGGEAGGGGPPQGARGPRRGHNPHARAQVGQGPRRQARRALAGWGRRGARGHLEDRPWEAARGAGHRKRGAREAAARAPRPAGRPLRRAQQGAPGQGRRPPPADGPAQVDQAAHHRRLPRDTDRDRQLRRPLRDPGGQGGRARDDDRLAAGAERVAPEDRGRAHGRLDPRPRRVSLRYLDIDGPNMGKWIADNRPKRE